MENKEGHIHFRPKSLEGVFYSLYGERRLRNREGFSAPLLDGVVGDVLYAGNIVDVYHLTIAFMNKNPGLTFVISEDGGQCAGIPSHLTEFQAK